MPKIKTSELADAALDWAVAKCEGYECEFGDEVSGPWLVPQEEYLHDKKPLASFRPSTNWAYGGPIIERERVSIRQWTNVPIVHAYMPQDDAPWASDDVSPLIAAMRCYVASKLGDEVDVPDELI